MLSEEEREAMKTLIKDKGVMRLVLELWDETYKGLSSVRNELVEGRSEYALLMLDNKLSIMNGQSRETLVALLQEAKARNKG